MPADTPPLDLWALVPIVGIAAGAIIIIVIITTVANYKKSVRNTETREESRREIAAYVAEGSITATEGENLLRAGEPRLISEQLKQMFNKH
ncbi:MAG: hypothetical protein ACF8SC_03170 [Phycisphaerales bacterium JB037]